MHGSVDFEVLSAFEQAAAPVWTMINDFTAVFADYENSHDDVPNLLKAMRGSYRSSLQLLHKLQPFERAIEQFAKRVGRLESYISSTAMNYGLNLLPDEVLSEIFVLAATTLEDKVALSLVCKRFRSVMMSMRKMWDGYRIESTQTPEQIIAIAEGKGFVSLKARILPSSSPSDCETWPTECGLDLTEYTPRYREFSAGLILSFGPEELEFSSLELDYGGCDEVRASYWKEIEPILARGNMQNLHKLIIKTQNYPGPRALENLHMPLLRHLDVNFVPRPTLARNLVQFRLSSYDVRLTELLDFLSSSEVLQELVIDGCYRFYEDTGTIDALPVVTMPSVVSCVFVYTEMDTTLIAKLRMPTLRTLILSEGRPDKLSRITRNEFRISLQSMSSIEVLELNSGVAHGRLDEIIRYAHPHLESFSLKRCDLYDLNGPSWNTTSLVPNRKLIHFETCMITSAFMLTFVNYLREIGLAGVKLQFSGCTNLGWWEDGTFGLDEVMQRYTTHDSGS